jgi:hypothetical protein
MEYINKEINKKINLTIIEKLGGQEERGRGGRGGREMSKREIYLEASQI